MATPKGQHHSGKSGLRQLPSVDKVLHTPAVKELAASFGKPLVTNAVRRSIEKARGELSRGAHAGLEQIVAMVHDKVMAVAQPPLKQVINATGVLLHTNLGRAPLGEYVLQDIAPIVKGYSNLEFDLRKAARGHRIDHVSEILTYLTGADDIAVVNNNAAAIILVLNTLARDKEVIISRGELIEIGGAFRIPEIMAAGGARMLEVGTTNRTRLADYEAAITPNTALLFKAHKSNYAISGFTEEASVAELARLARTHKIPLVYDIGSGLLRKPGRLRLENEPDVRGAIGDGADLVTFSCDKLLGGPQAGVIAGKRDLVKRLAKAPLMRALRVGKLTLVALGSACRHYLSDDSLVTRNPLFAMLERSPEELERLAGLLRSELRSLGVESTVANSSGQCGGGTLPDLSIESRAVVLDPPHTTAKERHAFATRVFHRLLERDKPVLAVLREGRLVFDVLTIAEEEIPDVAAATAKSIEAVRST